MNRKSVAALGVALSLVAISAPARAAEALAGVGGPIFIESKPGRASVGANDASAYSAADAYEFIGGVGVSAGAGSTGDPIGSPKANATAKASFSDSFTFSAVNSGSAVSFLLDIPMLVSGTVSIGYSGLPGNPNFTSTASAKYQYSWSVGGVSGTGLVSRVKLPTSVEQVTNTTTGGSNALLPVALGQTVAIALSAEAGVTALAMNRTPANATADFSHTLRWGGVAGLTAFDSSGLTVTLPSDFSFSLLSSATGFDYRNAAGPNPYTTAAVPEPAVWAMMIAGFGLAGAALRRRSPALA